MKKQLSLSLFLHLSRISLGQYSQRNGGGVEKKSYIKEWTYGDGCPRMKLWGTPTLMGHSCKDFHSLMLRDAEGWPEILLRF